MRRQGASLIEVLLALALVSTVGVILMNLIQSGARASARGTEMQLAAAVGARIMDRFLGSGFAALQPLAGRDEDLDLSSFGEPSAEGDRNLTVDRVTYSARYSLSEPDPGLLRLAITVAWNRPGASRATGTGSIELLRYVVDPEAAGR